MLPPASLSTATLTRVPHLREVRALLADGLQTTVYVATYPREQTGLRVVRLPELTQLEKWCRCNGTDEALVGGFYLRNAAVGDHALSGGAPLGELRVAGVALPFVPFSNPWGEVRACLHVDGPHVRIARRDQLPAEPLGDLLQAGPLLVSEGIQVEFEAEGFSPGADQFDSDITAGRHPRAGLGYDSERLFAVVCDGRADDDAGLTIDELATVFIELGASEAINLDGGGSASLVCAGELANVPRESHGFEVAGGREIATALVFHQN